MKIAVNIDAGALSDLIRLTGESKGSSAVAFVVKAFVKREKAREFGRLLREGSFDYAFTNDEIEKFGTC